ncbi:aldo/keto reductase [Micromonospora sp. NPDC051196]|uniref:aldo/keto reductase n=1 Tax=Micromonospora sp. NPDC051196 TaxID=3155281 RepID=UPI0034133687
MRTVELGRTGEQVSQIALGCMLMGTLTDEASSFEMLDRYLDAGGSFLDTANCYAWWPAPGNTGGESESLLGRWLARGGRRDQVFLATKCGARIPDPEEARGKTWEEVQARFEGASGDTIRRGIDHSLRRLGTDHVDLYYVHVDDRSTPLTETLSVLADIVRAGKARYIGWSNVRTWRLERIRQLCDRHGWPAPVAVQQQHSYLRSRAGLDQKSIVDGEQLDYLREHEDLTLIAYSPILKGVYDDPEKRQGHDIMSPYEGPDAEARLAALTALAAELDVRPTQLVLAWLLHQTSPSIVPLIGPRTLDQYDSAMSALDVKLDAAHVERLDAAGA